MQDFFEKFCLQWGCPLTMLQVPYAQLCPKDPSSGCSIVLEWVWKGLAVGVLADPSLSKWSSSGPGCSGPFRSLAFPLGRPFSSPSQWEQLEADNARLHAALHIAVSAGACGATCILFLLHSSPQAPPPELAELAAIAGMEGQGCCAKSQHVKAGPSSSALVLNGECLAAKVAAIAEGGGGLGPSGEWDRSISCAVAEGFGACGLEFLDPVPEPPELSTECTPFFAPLDPY